MISFSGFEKLSLLDYEGHISCTLFTNGCNFRCPFCHNSNLVLSEQTPNISLNEILEYLKKRKTIIDSVCITGGEPTLKKDLFDALYQLKDLGLLIKLDTNGTNPELLEKLIEKKLIDYCAMDIKTSWSKYHLATGLIGFNRENIQKSIDILLRGNIDYEFRTTLVSNFINEEDILVISKMITGAKRYYLQKFVNNENCITNNLTGYDQKKAQYFMSLIRKTIPNTNLRGY